ncbi:MAG: hypothetical protein R6X13_10460 [bacterium]
MYLLLGEALVTGRGYTELWRPVPVAHTQYPPVFPLAVAGVKLLFGTGSILPVKLLVLLCGFGAFLLALRFFRQLSLPVTEPGLVLLSVPVLLVLQGQVLTEVPFLFVSLAALLLLSKPRPQSLEVWVGILLVIVGLGLRTSGVALVAAAAVSLAKQRRWAPLIVLVLGSLGFLVAWQARATVLGGQSYLQLLLARDPYVQEFGRAGPLELLARLGTNALRYAFVVLPATLVPLAAAPVLREMVGAVIVLLVVLGVRARWRSASVPEYYAGAALLVLAAWPQVWSGDRFLVPVLPLLLMYLWCGARSLANRLRHPVLARVIAGSLVAANLLHLAPMVPRRVVSNVAWLRGDGLAGYEPEWRSYFTAIDWVGKNTSDKSVVMARKPEFVYLLARRRAFCYPFTNDRSAVLEALLRSDYVIFDNFRWSRTTQYFLNPVLQDNRELFRIAYVTGRPEFFVLQTAKRP